CEETFNGIPSEIIQKMDELQFEYVALMDKIGAVLRDNIQMVVMDVDNDEPVENLDPEDQAAIENQMKEITRVMGAAYALGWYSCADQPSVLQAAMVMQPCSMLINKGSHESLAYNFIKKGNKH